MRLPFCLLIAYCFSVFYSLVTSPVFWWWVWLSPRSAYQRYPAPVTFFCLSLSLFKQLIWSVILMAWFFRLVNLISYYYRNGLLPVTKFFVVTSTIWPKNANCLNTCFSLSGRRKIINSPIDCFSFSTIHQF